MATITDSGNFIQVTEDTGKITYYNKGAVNLSVKGNDFMVNDNSGAYIRLPFSTVSAPATANVYALRNAVTAMVT